MNNPTVLKLFSALSFIISAIFTINLMTSQATGMFTTIIMCIVGVILEFSKCFFLFKSLNSYHLPLTIRAVTVGISAILFLSSIVASLAFMYNQNNTNKNGFIKNSTEYKQAQESRQLKQALFTQKQQEINQLRQQAQELPKNYYSMKAQVMERVTAKTKELEQITQDLQAPKEIKVNFLQDKGYTAFLSVIADKLNEREPVKRWTLEELEILLFTILSIVFEFVAVFLFYIQQRETLINTIPHDSETRETYGKNTGKNHDKITTKSRQKFQVFKPREAIGFRLNNTTKYYNEGYNPEDLRRYVDYMYSTVRGNVALGYRTIGQAVNIDGETARKIKGALEQKGIIETVGNRTIVIKDRQEAIF